MKLHALIFGLLILASSSAAHAACMSGDFKEEIAEGRLIVRTFKDGMGRPEPTFILQLPIPACLDSADPDERVKATRTLHIYSGNDAVHAQIRRFVGKDVHVRGTVFSAHTVHDHAPIIMDIKEIDEI